MGRWQVSLEGSMMMMMPASQPRPQPAEHRERERDSSTFSGVGAAECRCSFMLFQEKGQADAVLSTKGGKSGETKTQQSRPPLCI